VNLVILDENNKKITSTKSNASENGMYYITGLKPGRKYYLSVNQPEYFKEKIEIQIPNTDKYLEISRDLLAKPLKKNAAIPFAIPPFELNKSKLRFGAAEILDDIARTLSYNPNVKIQIVCYPDNNNDKTANKKLSEDRANLSLTYLLQKDS
jgi:outer membrane protein OmpA-like peptidoglycan-associated protein